VLPEKSQYSQMLVQALLVTELLEEAITLLSESNVANDNVFGPIFDSINDIKGQFEESTSSATINEESLGRIFCWGNELIDKALASAKEAAQTSKEFARTVSFLTQSQALLYPIARLFESNAKPPPPPPPLPKIMKSCEGMERRKSPRATLETEVNMASSSTFFTGYTQDISEGGVFVATYNMQPMGSSIDLTLTLPNNTVIEVRGVVRWKREAWNGSDWKENDDAPAGMGIMFENLSENDREAINAFIEQRSPMFFDE
jgi:uncharacterized protein (TIGR02266 family)